MSTVTVKSSGKFEKTRAYLKVLPGTTVEAEVEACKKYGPMGVEALRKATPKDTGKTSESWKYKIDTTNEKYITIRWYNTNIVNGFNVAKGLQFGHGKKGGGYVPGINYINPAIKPIFEDIPNQAWRAVTGR